jgi:hypothetical protein
MVVFGKWRVDMGDLLKMSGLLDPFVSGLFDVSRGLNVGFVGGLSFDMVENGIDIGHYEVASSTRQKKHSYSSSRGATTSQTSIASNIAWDWSVLGKQVRCVFKVIPRSETVVFGVVIHHGHAVAFSGCLLLLASGCR